MLEKLIKVKFILKDYRDAKGYFEIANPNKLYEVRQ